MKMVGMVKVSAYDAQQLSALRVRLRTANWSALDKDGAFLLRGAFPSALLVPVAAHIAQSISTSPGHTKHLTRSSSNGEQGCYTFLSRAVTPTAVDQLADEVADVLRDRYGCSTVDVLARPSTGDGECLVLHYAQNGINYAHCDQPRGSAYLFQFMVCLSEPQDFDGGEFYVEDAGASARREDELTRTQLKFERAGDTIVFRAAPGAGRNWHHGSTRVEGPEDACRLVLGIGQPTTPREAVRHSGPVEPNWSSLPEDQYEDAVLRDCPRLRPCAPWHGFVSRLCVPERMSGWGGGRAEGVVYAEEATGWAPWGG
mmetsp:Transcript_37862/g.120414  ORF Transcript_37862/g.120414 Transcript_37862/m.120414 type:complete len:314 (+) Transcript_37862:40-981(+)